MKEFFLFFLMSVIASNGLAQKLNDKFEYKVTYKLTYKLDSTDLEEPKSEYMILYTGENLSKFSSRAKTLENPVVVRGNRGHTSRAALTQFHYELLKERTTGNMYYTLKIPKMDDRLYYPEAMDQFEWEILPETKKIKDYEVQKATTAFAGRKYVAWFTPEVPIAEGPYKFNGLPGLILEIADTGGHWVFELFGLEKLSPKLKYNLNLNQFVKTDREQLEALWYRYRRDPMGYAKNPNVKISPENHKKYVEAFTKMLEKENNPIELE
ncbi:GLPGLI family protein [Antarcticibacterium flavum]|uniref:GLPGLI family protein n=1 Tax=Antarcticibacterium flavum TaxID=2058175 RepID=A0A5B7X936_9FLAO|nr:MULTISPECIES: GLPGLI family protein [Antarcticibacterium]MCM4160898.1 GLPGLI family protein [Antarcticibacterium sp. W02-3]QCY71121.1 GLPGLI family protein [Antarcticibacterium flavum]